MKKIKICILLLMSAVMTSCTYLYSENSDSTVELRVFQTLSSTEALVYYTKYFDVAKIVTDEHLLYDGLVLTWRDAVVVDTYTYYNKGGDRKTVPVVMKRSEYKKDQ